jgi:hypothetical protein
LRPSAMSRYIDRNFAIDGGISKLDLTAPAKMPTRKNRIAGSIKFCTGVPFA